MIVFAIIDAKKNDVFLVVTILVQFLTIAKPLFISLAFYAFGTKFSATLNFTRIRRIICF